MAAFDSPPVKSKKIPENIVSPKAPDFNWDDIHASLQQCHQYAVATAQEAIEWYWCARRWKGRIGWTLRFSAIVFVSVGGILPLYTAAQGGESAKLSAWGYVLLAIAGGLIALDRLFGFTSTYIRYVLTATKIESHLAEFESDWARLLSVFWTRVPQGADVPQFVERSHRLAQSVRREIEDETTAWATEYRQTLVAMEKKLGEQAQSQDPGSIQLTVTDGDQVIEGGITIMMDGQFNQTIHGKTATLRPMFPGSHRVEATANLAGSPHRASTFVVVPPGQSVSVSLTLIGS